MGAIKFTTDRRERFLTLFERGETIEGACADVGVTRATVRTWAKRGRAPHPPDDGSAEFACRFDAIREGRNAPHLTQGDVIRLLERAARKGSVRAIALLLERPWEKGSSQPRQAQGRAVSCATQRSASTAFASSESETPSASMI